MLANAREGKPGLLVLTCYRFFGHARMDKSPYRDSAEEEQGRQRDPLKFARERLIARKGATEENLDALDAEIATEMDNALEQAIKEHLPDVSTMFEDVYAPDQPKPTPLRDRLSAILSETSR